MRQLPLDSRIRRALADKLKRAVADAVKPLLAEQTERLERQVAEARAEAQRAYDRVIEFEIRSRRDLVYAADQRAAREAAEFVIEHMPSAPRFGERLGVLEHGLKLAPADGMALEFGVFQGTSLKLIAETRQTGGVYGFDSFKGLPEQWGVDFAPGHFAVDELPDVPGAELVVGWFDETLPGFLDERQGHVGLLHVDCDLYSSTKTVLELVGPRLRPGSIVVFDEFFNYPAWKDGEYRAWTEYVEKTGISFEYVGYSYVDEQVVVRIGEAD
ncbi:class I SAM-dependent methyltransferase [Amycolatopsis sp. cg5]|uniref:class I SAM-dependent methyltransferase n=1 Tax=Amycolatopsis sp. cg5 TaxID=3238802 RepID=UPI0035268FDE